MTKRKTKLFNLIIIFLLSLIFIGVFTACNNKNQNQGQRQEYSGTVKSRPDWREKLVKKTYDTESDKIIVDGSTDEQIWQNSYPLTYERRGITVEVRIVFGNDGFYLSYTVDDNFVTFNFLRDNYNNSSAELYFTTSDTTELNSQVLQFRCNTNGEVITYSAIDTSGSFSISYPWMQRYLPAYALTKVENIQGDFSSIATGTGFTSEAFIAWDTLGLSERPDSIKVYPTYNFNEGTEKEKDRSGKIEPIGAYNNPKTYYIFDAQGYVNNDSRIISQSSKSVVIGDGIGQMPKSNAWDLTQVADGIVKSDGAVGAQYIYFKGIYAENYLISAKIKHINGSYGDAMARVGIVVAAKNSQADMESAAHSSFLLSCYDADKNAAGFQPVARFFDEPGWQMTSDKSIQGYGTKINVTDDYVKLSAIKRGNLVHYFVNDIYFESRRLNNISQNTVPGLVSIGSDSIFTEVTATTNQSEMDNYISASDVVEVEVITNANGTAKCEVIRQGEIVARFDSAYLITKGDNLKITLQPREIAGINIQATSVKVNHIEMIQQVTNNQITINNLQNKVLVEIEFLIKN